MKRLQEPIYISGPMTGYPDLNRTAFNDAASRIRAAGYEVVNPAEVDLGPDARWEDYMRHDLRLMLDCKTVVALSGWALSKGAKIEVDVAQRLGLDVMSYEILKLAGQV